MNAITIHQRRILRFNRIATVDDSRLIYEEQSNGTRRRIETPLGQVLPTPQHIKISLPKFLTLGLLLLSAAIALITIAIRIADLNVGSMIVLLAVILGVLGEQLLEKYWNTKCDVNIFVSSLTGDVVLLLESDLPSKDAVDEFTTKLVDRLHEFRPKPEVLDIALHELRAAKQMLDEGLISASDYEKKKESALGTIVLNEKTLH